MGPDDGISHDVFKESSQANPDEEQQEEGLEEGEEVKSIPEKDIIDTFKHVYVPEVVREPRMLFHKVPRLGAYMAVPLVYKSCLFDQALEDAVADVSDMAQRNEALEREKVEYYEGFNSRKEAAEAAGEVFDEEERSFEEVEQREYTYFDEKYVVMLDTLGQDRQFTVDQKRFILNTVARFGDLWEKQEAASLTVDRDNKIASSTVEARQTEAE